MRFKSTKTPERGAQRVVKKFAWLPVELGEKKDVWRFDGVKVWLESYYSVQVWFDNYYNRDYRWREVARTKLDDARVKPEETALALKAPDK